MLSQGNENKLMSQPKSGVKNFSFEEYYVIKEKSMKLDSENFQLTTA